MGVEFYWKRVPTEVASACSPAERRQLVPSWSDERFEAECASGTLVMAGDTGAIIAALLWLGATDDAGEAAADAFGTATDDWDTDLEVGTLPPDAVGMIADFLADAPLEQWMQDNRAALGKEVEEMGYVRPFDDGWAAQVLVDARDLTDLFRAAAASGETVIVKFVG
jgi:hypothetical protein